MGFKGIITLEEVNISGLPRKFLALFDEYRSANIELFANMLAVIALADLALGLERQVAKLKYILFETERKFKVGCSAALPVQHSASARAYEARKYGEKLNEAVERLRIELMAAEKTCDDAKTADV